MNSRPYYFAGKPLLTQQYSGFLKPYDIALYEDHPVTADRVRESIGGELQVCQSSNAFKKFRYPVYGNGCEMFTWPEYRVPLFTVYIPNENHLQQQDAGCYKVQRKDVVIQEVSVCGDSYTYSFYPSSYYTFFEKKAENETISGIRALFRDYAHPRFGLFISMHWNRHYTSLADVIVKEMPEKTQDAYDYLMGWRNKLTASDQTNLAGSMMRRLDFAIGKLIAEINKDNEPALRAKR